MALYSFYLVCWVASTTTTLFTHLEEEAVDHHQISDSGCASQHHLSSDDHGSRHAGGEDQALPQVEQGEAVLGLDSGSLVRTHALVVPVGVRVLRV